jgi:hypothetical protein
MASPSGIVDGEARWFENGQLTTDPGIARTTYGIPVDCAGPPFGFYCLGLVGQDFNFYLRLPDGKIIGFLRWQSVSSSWAVEDPDGGFAGHAECIAFSEVGGTFYNMSVVTNLVDGTPRQYVAHAPDSQDVPVPLDPITGAGPAPKAYLWWGP